MHEFSLVRALLKQVDALTRQQPHQRVVAIHVSIGEFSGVEPQLFRSAYQTLIEDSHMTGAELQIQCDPLLSHCDKCGHDFVVERFRFECPQCSGRDVTIVSGEGLVLERVILEQSESSAEDETAVRSSSATER